ncbi:putative adenosine deaminase [Aspergillus clavatus NRRL 1]|uniref:Adenosine deaminase, putative n=1 Tax=Aspergillus clavatus (strain ATCC 1007 / CBS 513.65 / DSM 816 / NCTC 3887 / NRRL 1 / QM 1276 / 107) TaxID=344612 RepID=A1CPD5_ASPCL|nr:adenosine deaminase, putative [Aspergillus clavatus NRRL 1]EAW07506.1 adenosine deaminase, putative [Aspergillus clavatus NRRL 1]
MDFSKPVDAAFTKALPKVEVHAHLNGSISRQCLHEIWLKKKAQDPEFDVEDPLVVIPPGKVDCSLQTFFQTFSQSIYHLCNDLESLRYATHSVLKDFLADGVRYLELRTIPRASSAASFSREEYVSTIISTIDDFQSTHPGQMPTYLILAIDRGHSDSADALEIIDLAIAHSQHVVGVDVCGNPARGDVSLYRDAFAKAKAAGLGITVHFAETPVSGSPNELETLLSFRPDRLGHVIHVPEDFKREIARRRLGLELCMSCNVHAEMIDGGFPNHHFGYWRHVDCPVVLCTDDMGFFCSPVSNEYMLAAEHFHLSREEVLSLSRESVDVIFGGQAEKERMRGLLLDFEEIYKS